MCSQFKIYNNYNMNMITININKTIKNKFRPLASLRINDPALKQGYTFETRRTN